MQENGNRKTLEYLGEEFQKQLIHTFLDEHEFFQEIYPILNQNMFSDAVLRTCVGLIKDYYEKYNSVPSYRMMETMLRERAYTDIDRDIHLATFRTIVESPTDGVEYVREMSTRFFRQQNMIRVANEILKVAKDGDLEQYDRCVELMEEASVVGTHDDLGIKVTSNIDDVLSDEYRTPIPTGIEVLDDLLEGGLGKGEVGLIIGPSGFGKAQSLESRIVTPNGYARMGDMAVGREVIGRDGKPHKVTGVFPQGKRPMYEVRFSDGTKCECDIEHLWTSSNGRTMTLKEIIDDKMTNGKDFIMPRCKPVEFDDDGSVDYDDIDKQIASISTTALDERYLFMGIDKRRALVAQVEMSQESMFEVEDDGYYVTTRFTDNGSAMVYKAILASLGIHGKVSGREVTRTSWKESVRMSGFEYIGEKEAQCIMVDSDEHLYLTEELIVTHNTSITTSFATEAAVYACEDNQFHGYRVLQVITEDRPAQIQRKHIAKITGIESKDLSKPHNIGIVKERIAKFPSFAAWEENMRILRARTGDTSVLDIRRKIQKLTNNGFKPDMVVIDYFEALNHNVHKGIQNEFLREAASMRQLEAMAQDFNIAIWVPSQGTKDSAECEVVTMSKNGGAVQKTQIAHIVISIARTEEDKKNNKATIALLKNRAGMSGAVLNDCYFNNGTCTIIKSRSDMNAVTDFAQYSHKKTDADNQAILYAQAKAIAENMAKK